MSDATVSDPKPRPSVTWVRVSGSATSRATGIHCIRCECVLAVPSATLAARFDALLFSFCLDHEGCAKP